MKKIIIIFVLLLTLPIFGQNQEAQEIVNAGLVELGIKSVEVRIMPIPDYLKGLVKGHGDELEGFIRGGQGKYILYLKELNKSSLLRVVSHELIHLKQMEEGRLLTTSENIVFFDGKEYNGKDMSYFQKPWEDEAVGQGDNLRFKIKRLIKNR